MTFFVEFDPVAEQEFFKAIGWYEERSEGLGDRFEHAVEQIITTISRSPLIYSKKRSNIREGVVDDFPYVVVYKIFDDRNVIYITSIFHTSRNPRKKYRS